MCCVCVVTRVAEHTRSIAMVVPKTGGIVGFVKKKLQCLSCKTALKGGETTVCAHCSDHEALIYQKQLVVVRRLEMEFSAAWTQCQRCQGSLHQTVLCSARDCKWRERERERERKCVCVLLTGARRSYLLPSHKGMAPQQIV